MKRIMLAATIALACLTAKERNSESHQARLNGRVATFEGEANGQEQQDSLKAADLMQELQEVVVKGNLPNTRLKGNAMITRIQTT